MLSTRILTGLIAAALVIAALFYLPAVFVILLIAALIGGGAYEWGGFINANLPPVRLLFAIGVITLILLAEVLIIHDPQRVRLVMMAGLVFWAFALVTILSFPRKFSAVLTTLAGLFVLLPAFVALSAIYLAKGPLYLLGLLVVVCAADIGAYFCGRQFGKHKLAPAVSPGKTWEGVFGGVIAAAIVAGVGASALGLDWQRALPVAIGIAAISVIGDLTVSMFKRNASIKDSGKLFPGHGGIMDRIDSVSAAAPLFVFFMLGAPG